MQSSVWIITLLLALLLPVVCGSLSANQYGWGYYSGTSQSGLPQIGGTVVTSPWSVDSASAKCAYSYNETDGNFDFSFYSFVDLSALVPSTTSIKFTYLGSGGNEFDVCEYAIYSTDSVNRCYQYASNKSAVCFCQAHTYFYNYNSNHIELQVLLKSSDSGVTFSPDKQQILWPGDPTKPQYVLAVNQTDLDQGTIVLDLSAYPDPSNPPQGVTDPYTKFACSCEYLLPTSDGCYSTLDFNLDPQARDGTRYVSRSVFGVCMLYNVKPGTYTYNFRLAADVVHECSQGFVPDFIGNSFTIPNFPRIARVGDKRCNSELANAKGAFPVKFTVKYGVPPYQVTCFGADGNATSTTGGYVSSVFSCDIASTSIRIEDIVGNVNVLANNHIISEFIYQVPNVLSTEDEGNDLRITAVSGFYLPFFIRYKGLLDYSKKGPWVEGNLSYNPLLVNPPESSLYLTYDFKYSSAQCLYSHDITNTTFLYVGVGSYNGVPIDGLTFDSFPQVVVEGSGGNNLWSSPFSYSNPVPFCPYYVDNKYVTTFYTLFKTNDYQSISVPGLDDPVVTWKFRQTGTNWDCAISLFSQTPGSRCHSFFVSNVSGNTTAYTLCYCSHKHDMFTSLPGIQTTLSIQIESDTGIVTNNKAVVEYPAELKFTGSMDSELGVYSVQASKDNDVYDQNEDPAFDCSCKALSPSVEGCITSQDLSYDRKTKAANGDRLWSAASMGIDCTFYNLPPGTYHFNPRTSHDCIGKNRDITITVPNTPRLVPVSDKVCFGASTPASFSFKISYGTAPYTIDILDTATSDSSTKNAATSNTVVQISGALETTQLTITDATNNVQTINDLSKFYMYTEPSGVQVSSTPRTCADSHDQTITLDTVAGIKYPFMLNLTSSLNTPSKQTSMYYSEDNINTFTGLYATPTSWTASLLFSYGKNHECVYERPIAQFGELDNFPVYDFSLSIKHDLLDTKCDTVKGVLNVSVDAATEVVFPVQIFVTEVNTGTIYTNGAKNVVASQVVTFSLPAGSYVINVASSSPLSCVSTPITGAVNIGEYIVGFDPGWYLPTCAGNGDGSLHIFPVGSTADHLKILDSQGTVVGTSDSTPNLKAGTYTVEAKMDSPQACTYKQTYTFPDREAYVIDYDYYPATCNSLGNVTIYQASGERGLAVYLLDTDTSEVITEYMYVEKNVANVTILAVPDKILHLKSFGTWSNCPVKNSDIVIDFRIRTNLTFEILSNTSACYNSNSGFVTLQGKGSVGPYTFSVPDASSGLSVVTLTSESATISGMKGGVTYTIRVTDLAGCSEDKQVSVQEFPSFTADLGVLSTSCDASSAGSLVIANITSPYTPYSYSLQLQYQKTKTSFRESAIAGLPVGDHSVFIYDNYGCGIQKDFTVEARSAPSFTVVPTSPTCFGDNTGSILVKDVTNHQAPYNLSIISSTKGSVGTSNLFADTFQVTLTDAAGCVGRGFVTVAAPTAIVATISVTQQASAQGSQDGTVRFTVTSGRTPITYTVDSDTTVHTATTGANDVTGLGAGTHYITLTDSAGCSSIVSVDSTTKKILTVLEPGVPSTIPDTPVAIFNLTTNKFEITGVVGTPEFVTVPIQHYKVEVAEGSSDTPISDATWTTFSNNQADVSSKSTGDAWSVTWASGFVKGKIYMFRVKAGNQYGFGSPSKSVYAAWISTPESVQVAPLVETQKIGLQVMWHMPTSSNRYTFNVAVTAQSGVGSTVVSTNVTSESANTSTDAGPSNPVYSVVITSLSAGTGYNISVQAVLVGSNLPNGNPTIVSAFSSGVADHPVGLPSEPLNARVASFSLCKDGGYVDLNWTYPLSNGFFPNFTAIGYKIEQLVAGNGVTVAAVNYSSIVNMTYRVTKPASSPAFSYGVTYEYRISTINAKGTSPNYASASFQMFDKPCAPTNLKITSSYVSDKDYNSSVSFSWEDGSSTFDRVLYSIFAKYDDPVLGSFTQQLSAGVSPTKSTVVSGLRNLKYTFWMTSFISSASESSSSVQIDLRSAPVVDAGALSCSVAWELTAAAVTLSWTPVDSVHAQGSPIISYQFVMITRTNDNTTTPANVTTTIVPNQLKTRTLAKVLKYFTFSGLQSGLQLSWGMKACNVYGCSTLKDTISCDAQTAPPVPPIPTITTILANPLNGSLLLQLDWHVLSSIVDGGFTSGYVIQFSADGTTFETFESFNASVNAYPSYSKIFNFTQTSNVNQDIKYYWRVFALNAMGSTASDVVSYLNTYPPITPTLLPLLFNSKTNSVTVNWYGPNVATAGYYIQIRTNNVYGFLGSPINVTIMSSSTTSFTFDNLQVNQPYVFSVAAFSVYAGTTTPKAVSAYSPTQLQFTSLPPAYKPSDVKPDLHGPQNNEAIGTTTVTSNFVPEYTGLTVYFAIFQVTSYYADNTTDIVLLQNNTLPYYKTVVSSAIPSIIRWRFQLCSRAGCGSDGDLSDPVYILLPPSNVQNGAFLSGPNGLNGPMKYMDVSWDSVIGALLYAVDYSTDAGATWKSSGTIQAPQTASKIGIYDSNFGGLVGKPGMLRVQAQSSASYSNYTTLSFTFATSPGGMSPPTVSITSIPTASDHTAQWHVNWTEAVFSELVPVTYTLLMGSYVANGVNYQTVFSGESGLERDITVTNTPGQQVYFQMFATNQYGDGRKSLPAIAIAGKKPVAPAIEIVGYSDYYLSPDYTKFLAILNLPRDYISTLPCVTYKTIFKQVSGGDTYIYIPDAGSSVIKGDTLNATFSECSAVTNVSKTLKAYGVNKVGTGDTSTYTFDFFPPPMCRLLITSLSWVPPAFIKGQRYGPSSIHIEWRALVHTYNIEVHTLQYSKDGTMWQTVDATLVKSNSQQTFHSMDLSLPSGFSYTFRVWIANKVGTQYSATSTVDVFPAPTVCGAINITKDDTVQQTGATINMQLPPLCTNEPLINKDITYSIDISSSVRNFKIAGSGYNLNQNLTLAPISQTVFPFRQTVVYTITLTSKGGQSTAVKGSFYVTQSPPKPDTPLFKYDKNWIVGTGTGGAYLDLSLILAINVDFYAYNPKTLAFMYKYNVTMPCGKLPNGAGFVPDACPFFYGYGYSFIPYGRAINWEDIITTATGSKKYILSSVPDIGTIYKLQSGFLGKDNTIGPLSKMSPYQVFCDMSELNIHPSTTSAPYDSGQTVTIVNSAQCLTILASCKFEYSGKTVEVNMTNSVCEVPAVPAPVQGKLSWTMDGIYYETVNFYWTNKPTVEDDPDFSVSPLVVYTDGTSPVTIGSEFFTSVLTIELFLNGRPVQYSVSAAGLSFIAPATTMVSGPRAVITYTLNGRSYSVKPLQNLFYINSVPAINSISKQYFKNTDDTQYNNIAIGGSFDPVVSQVPVYVLFRSATWGELYFESSLSSTASQIKFDFPVVPGSGDYQVIVTYDQVHESTVVGGNATVTVANRINKCSLLTCADCMESTDGCTMYKRKDGSYYCGKTMPKLPVGYSKAKSCAYTIIDDMTFEAALNSYSSYNSTHSIAQFAVSLTIIAGDESPRSFSGQCFTSTLGWIADSRLYDATIDPSESKVGYQAALGGISAKGEFMCSFIYKYTAFGEDSAEATAQIYYKDPTIGAFALTYTGSETTITPMPSAKIALGDDDTLFYRADIPYFDLYDLGVENLIGVDSFTNMSWVLKSYNSKSGPKISGLKKNCTSDFENCAFEFPAIFGTAGSFINQYAEDFGGWYELSLLINGAEVDMFGFNVISTPLYVKLLGPLVKREVVCTQSMAFNLIHNKQTEEIDGCGESARYTIQVPQIPMEGGDEAEDAGPVEGGWGVKLEVLFKDTLTLQGEREAELEGEFEICAADKCGFITLILLLKTKMISGSREVAPDSKFLQLVVTVKGSIEFAYAAGIPFCCMASIGIKPIVGIDVYLTHKENYPEGIIENGGTGISLSDQLDLNCDAIIGVEISAVAQVGYGGILGITLQAAAGVTIYIAFSYPYVVKKIVISFEASADVCYVVGCSGVTYSLEITLQLADERKRYLDLSEVDLEAYSMLTESEKVQIMQAFAATPHRSKHTNARVTGFFIHNGTWAQENVHQRLQARSQGSKRTAGEVDGYLVRDAYPFSKPTTSYISQSALQMILWTADSGAGVPGSTYIMFNVLDASSETLLYTSPVNLTSHIGSPFVGATHTPYVVLLDDSSTMLVVWCQLGPYAQQDGSPITNPNDQAQIESYMRTVELAFAVYNSVSKTFSQATKFTTNSLIDMSPFVVCIPSASTPAKKAFVVWTQASSISADSKAKVLALKYSKFDGTSFSAEASIGTSISQSDTIGLAASETHAVLIYTQQINDKTVYGYIQSFEFASGLWNTDIQTFHFDATTAKDKVVVSPSITYHGSNQFVVMWIVDNLVTYRMWSPNLSVAYMKSHYPLMSIQDPQDDTANPTFLILGTQVTPAHQPTPASYTTVAQWVARVKGDQYVYSAILGDSEDQFSDPVYSNYGSTTDITRKTLVPATGMFSASPYADYPSIYSVYVEADRVLVNGTGAANFNISSVNHGDSHIKYEVISLAPKLILDEFQVYNAPNNTIGLVLTLLNKGATSLNSGLMYLDVLEDSSTTIAKTIEVPSMAANGGQFTSSSIIWTPSKLFVDSVRVELRFSASQELVSSTDLIVAVPNIASASLFGGADGSVFLEYEISNAFPFNTSATAKNGTIPLYATMKDTTTSTWSVLGIWHITLPTKGLAITAVIDLSNYTIIGDISLVAAPSPSAISTLSNSTDTDDFAATTTVSNTLTKGTYSGSALIRVPSHPNLYFRKDATLLTSSIVTPDNFAVVAFPSNDKFVSAIDVSLSAVIVGEYQGGKVVVSSYTNVTANATVDLVNYGNVKPASIQVSNLVAPGIYQVNIILNANHDISEFLFTDNTQSVAVVVYPRADLFVSADKVYLDVTANMLRFHVLNRANNSLYDYEAFGSFVAKIQYYGADSGLLATRTVTLPHISDGSSLLINSTVPTSPHELIAVTITVLYPTLNFAWSPTDSNGTTLLNPPSDSIAISSTTAVLANIKSIDFTRTLAFGIPTIIAPDASNLEEPLMGVPFVLPISIEYWDKSYDPIALLEATVDYPSRGVYNVTSNVTLRYTAEVQVIPGVVFASSQIDGRFYQKVSLMYIPPPRAATLVRETVKVHVLLLSTPGNLNSVLSNVTFALSVANIAAYPLPTNGKSVLQNNGKGLITFMKSVGGLYTSDSVTYSVDRIVRPIGSSQSDFSWTNVKEWTPSAATQDLSVEDTALDVLTKNVLIDYRIGVKTEDYPVYNYQKLDSISHLVDTLLTDAYAIKELLDLSSFISNDQQTAISADSEGNIIVTQSPQGIVSSINAVTKTAQSVSQSIVDPVSPLFDATTDSLYVVDNAMNCVVRINLDSDTPTEETVAGDCTSNSALSAPTLIALDVSNQVLYVLDGSTVPLKSVTLSTKALHMIDTTNVSVSLSDAVSMTFVSTGKTLYIGIASSHIYAISLQDANIRSQALGSSSSGKDTGDSSYIDFANNGGLASASSSQLLVSTSSDILMLNAATSFVQPVVSVQSTSSVVPVQSGVFFTVSKDDVASVVYSVAPPAIALDVNFYSTAIGAQLTTPLAVIAEHLQLVAWVNIVGSSSAATVLFNQSLSTIDFSEALLPADNRILKSQLSINFTLTAWNRFGKSVSEFSYVAGPLANTTENLPPSTTTTTIGKASTTTTTSGAASTTTSTQTGSSTGQAASGDSTSGGSTSGGSTAEATTSLATSSASTTTTTGGSQPATSGSQPSSGNAAASSTSTAGATSSNGNGPTAGATSSSPVDSTTSSNTGTPTTNTGGSGDSTSPSSTATNSNGATAGTSETTAESTSSAPIDTTAGASTAANSDSTSGDSTSGDSNSGSSTSGGNTEISTSANSDTTTNSATTSQNPASSGQATTTAKAANAVTTAAPPVTSGAPGTIGTTGTTGTPIQKYEFTMVNTMTGDPDTFNTTQYNQVIADQVGVDPKDVISKIILKTRAVTDFSVQTIVNATVTATEVDKFKEQLISATSSPSMTNLLTSLNTTSHGASVTYTAVDTSSTSTSSSSSTTAEPVEHKKKKSSSVAVGVGVGIGVGVPLIVAICVTVYLVIARRRKAMVRGVELEQIYQQENY